MTARLDWTELAVILAKLPVEGRHVSTDSAHALVATILLELRELRAEVEAIRKNTSPTQ